MEHRAVIAIGGNALILDGQRGTIDEQRDNATETARHMAQHTERNGADHYAADAPHVVPVPSGASSVTASRSNSPRRMATSNAQRPATGVWIRGVT